MKYNFDKAVNRHNTNCVKWDEMTSNDIIPMWVADMDFETAPCVLEALLKRMQHGCFGYTFVPESYYEATIQWFQRRHAWTINRNSFIYTSGVVPAISAIIKAMTQEGDQILTMTPVYNCFFSSIRNNGCQMVESALKPTTISVDSGRTAHTYIVDWEDFEQKCADPKTKVFLLCNPHNPVGRVWTKEELMRMGEICLRHKVFVISDEIHCEFVTHQSRPEKMAELVGEKEVRFTPFASLSEEFAMNSAVCLSPSKAFNIAGLQIANIIVKDEETRKKVDKAININEVCDVNPFGVIALQAAYSTEGEEWLEELNQYIHENDCLAKEMLERELPQCPLVTLEGTYLQWMNISTTGKSAQEVADFLVKEEKVYVNPGTMYGEKAGEGYIRINLATRREMVETGVERIIRGIKKIMNK